jgi:4-amino-4-deoxy-L-arabinose transferase-like glycosyltransferase
MGNVLTKAASRRATLLLAATILLAIVLRVGFVFTLEEDLYWPDPHYYDLIAWRIVSGEPLQQAISRAPFQAFVMAVPYWLAGHSYRAAYLFQAFLGGLIPLLVFLIGRHLKSPAVGLVAALLSAVYPYYVYIAGALYATQTTTILLLAVVWAALKSRESGAWGHLIGQGVALGALILTRSISVALLPLAFLWNLRGRRPLVSAVLVCAVAVAVVSPWSVRNYLANDEFIPVSVGGGKEFLSGNNPDYSATIRRYELIPDELEAVRESMTPAAWDRLCWQEGLALVRENPGRSARLYVSKLLGLYRFAPETISENEFTSARTKWISMLSYGPVLLCGLAGIWLERRRWRRYAPVLGAIGAYTFVYPAFTTCVRYRVPIDAYFMVFAAVTIVWAWSGLRARGGRRPQEMGGFPRSSA